MPAYYEIRGTGDFRRAARRLKEAGNGQLTRRMSRGMRTAAKPAVDAAQRSVRSLEASATRGGGGQARREFALGRKRKKTETARRKAFEGRGLRSSTARAIGTQVRSSGQSASVRVRVNTRQLPPDQRTLPAHMNEGRWRHPVFGGDRWVTQTVSRDEWFDEPMREHGPKIRQGAAKVVDDILREIAQ
ncbi:hypothetical protein [Prauserella muralis]|uniref:Uncharacterized protein n=1 Tax=Prauserella muralis TaxID=588067 RepID=A0A2V4ALK8_9PSEU|nr:hypothetical protein [Prauserella muralis]PXY21122.1 hypothetical protein BAY60_27025 [Prauserella muralis]TWE30209.1 hypothetical protein FHX69_2906 [Prauserella muralis]